MARIRGKAQAFEITPEKVDRDEWVLACWCANSECILEFVMSIAGKPNLSFCPTREIWRAYKWRSWHAARKFQKAHRVIAGYAVWNLSEIRRQADNQREIERLIG